VDDTDTFAATHTAALGLAAPGRKEIAGTPRRLATLGSAVEGANQEHDMHTVRASLEQTLPSMAVLVVGHDDHQVDGQHAIFLQWHSSKNFRRPHNSSCLDVGKQMHEHQILTEG
jgi:hypothetical protein